MLKFHADPDLIIAEAGDEARPARKAGEDVGGFAQNGFEVGSGRGEAVVDLAFDRVNSHTVVAPRRRTGDLRVRLTR